MKWKQINREAYGPLSEIVTVDHQDIHSLKEQVMNCPNKRIRICAHENSDDNLHEMIIIIAKGSYIRPHKHHKKSESFHIIDGLLDVIVFDDVGNVVKIIPMGDSKSGKNFFYRLSAAYFHTLILKTDLVIFHETTQGPWNKGDTEYAPWSPEAGDVVGEQEYFQNLEIKMSQCG